jgi:hypothetical protein
MPPGFRHLEGLEVVLREWRAEPLELAKTTGMVASGVGGAWGKSDGAMED